MAPPAPRRVLVFFGGRGILTQAVTDRKQGGYRGLRGTPPSPRRTSPLQDSPPLDPVAEAILADHAEPGHECRRLADGRAAGGLVPRRGGGRGRLALGSRPLYRDEDVRVVRHRGPGL